MGKVIEFKRPGPVVGDHRCKKCKTYVFPGGMVVYLKKADGTTNAMIRGLEPGDLFRFELPCPTCGADSVVFIEAYPKKEG
jgi:hypothetical protein